MSSTENTQESPRRRRSPLVVASVAAAVLVAGGGGAYFATAGSEGADATDAKSGAAGAKNPPPPALDLGGSGTESGIAPGEPDPTGGGVVYSAKGDLPEGPGRAAVHRATGTVTEAEVTRLAKALGLPGTPRLEGPAWKIGPTKDGQGPSLQVNKDAPGTWTFARFASPGGDNCLKGKACPSGGSAGEGGAPVSEAEAEKAAAPVLRAVGQGEAALNAGQLMGAVRVVNANPVVGGLPTYGWTTGVQVGADGTVVGGSGQLKKPAKSDTYPVISAEEAVDQLNKAGKDSGRIGIGGCATPVPHEGEIKPDAPCEPDSTTAGPERLTIGKAVFGLSAQYVDGRQALVPSWLFEVAAKDGDRPFTVTHTAVEERFLKSAEPPARDIAPADPSKDPASQGPAQISYSVEGRTLTVTFWGGVCSNYEAKATESGDQVKVRIVETNPDPERVCIMLAKELKASVTLDEPLDGRKVVDANTGKPLPRKG
ncbi:hypothetical protein [Streptomyces sp. V1I6]|uniref:hypothetical protein n=1 Tax=Streptomyces sp. V1I6 TaxID=3042273 RepID=UPI00277D9C1F|nr:hypothetical protein [Streptomyces sp. V1I6]MDQ0842260.1 hypothetical protein [Streptomyces sp. V1I6]